MTKKATDNKDVLKWKLRIGTALQRCIERNVSGGKRIFIEHNRNVIEDYKIAITNLFCFIVFVLLLFFLLYSCFFFFCTLAFPLFFFSFNTDTTATSPTTTVATSSASALSIQYSELELESALHDAVSALNNPVTLDIGTNFVLSLAKTKKQSTKKNEFNEVNIEQMKQVEQQLKVLNNQVSKHLELNKLQESCTKQIQCVRLEIQMFGMIHENTADSLDLLGLICESMMKWKQASLIHRHALGIRMSTLGSEHKDTIRSMGRLGCSLDRVGDRKERAECLLLAAAGRHEKFVMVGMNNTGKARSSGLRMRGELESMYERRGDFEKLKGVKKV